MSKRTRGGRPVSMRCARRVDLLDDGVEESIASMAVQGHAAACIEPTKAAQPPPTRLALPVELPLRVEYDRDCETLAIETAVLSKDQPQLPLLLRLEFSSTAIGGLQHVIRTLEELGHPFGAEARGAFVSH